nr:hypothetical protein [Tanacetum cinerariifolium]
MLHVLRVEMVINSPWMLSKNWLVQKQTDFGKDISNPFMADNLAKIVWFSTHHVTFIKSWLVQKQTALGDVTRLQALVDKKKIVIFEAVIREILQLNDAEGIVCFPNKEIFAGLAQMGYEKPSTKLTFYKAFFSSQWKFLIHTILQSLSTKRTSWNEFSTTMASAVICLSKGQKFNFSKVGKGFSGVETPLFEGMLVVVQPAEEGLVADQVPVDAAIDTYVAEDISHDTIPSPPPHVIPSPTQEQSSPPQQQQSSPQAPPKDAEFPTQLQQVLNVCSALSKRVENLEIANGRMIADIDMNEGIELVKDAKVAESKGRNAAEHAEKQAEIYNLDLDHSLKVLISTASTTIPAASATIPAAKPTIPAAAPTVVAAYIRRRKGVKIRAPEEELPLKTPAETPKVNDKEYARKLHEEIDRGHDDFNKDIDWDASMDHNTTSYKMDFFKGMTYAQICPIFQARFDENIRFLFKSREEMEEEDQEIIKSINETPKQKAAKRRKLSEEAQEAKDLRKRLEVVEDEDDDVFVKATPLASKVPVVDYQIVLIDNKPRFKIIRADETHQFYISFPTLLNNFDREDLETLWRILKDRFSTSKPTNFLDEYLLLTLRTMFEEPDGQDAI